MKKAKNYIQLCLFIFLPLGIYAQQNTYTAKKSQWKGFERLDFTWENKEVRLVKPNEAAPGNPWIWRARFPDWHTEADSILVAEGFHLVYINTNNQYGSPKAVATWNSLYQHVTTHYQLQKKVALMGVSRGGLFVYNWAKANPNKVACIYAEAPVCDFTSWPMGKNGKRSDSDWKQLKAEYGFATDKEAIAYANKPVDNLEALAREKVPVLHMIGLQDKVVPPEENTFVLIDKYIRLGGIATVVPCTEGKQNLEGHHFDIETPRRVADFIKYHSLQDLPRDASDYHQLRAGLKNSQIQFERNKKGRVAFLGGSITYNGGWRDSLMLYLQKRFPETTFDFVAAGIPSMGSTPSAFRLERDILSKGKIDLLFVEAAVNDATNGRTEREQVRAMEGIVRHMRSENPVVDIVSMHFVDPDKMRDYRSGRVPDVIINHERVAEHYGVPTINLAKEVTDRIDNGEFTWEQDFKNLHPSPFGQGVYARSMIQLLQTAYPDHLDPDDKLTAHQMPGKLDAQCYDRGKLIEVSTIKQQKGWKVEASWQPQDGKGTRSNYVNVPMLISEKTGATLKVPFTGRAIGIAVAAGADAGMIEYRVDKGDWQTLDLFTRWSMHLHLPWYYTLSAGLSEGRHTLELRVMEQRNEQSQGNACRIRYFFTNQ